MLNSVSWSVRVAITNYHRLGGLNSKYLFLTVQEGGKTKIKAPADSMSGEGLIPGSLMVFCHHMTDRGEGSLRGLFYKDTNAIHEGSALMTQSPPKCPTSKYPHPGD